MGGLASAEGAREDTQLIPQELLDCFPEMYADGWHDAPVGWTHIMVRLSYRLNDIYPGIKCAQSKSKFGALRWYLDAIECDDATFKQIRDTIREAEIESARTCEECGNEGAPTEEGWVRTLCPACLPKWEARKRAI